ncbi:MAG TPA: ABC transporter substrate-binding protein, partial [Chloroflexia bacterium]|nr:ABC transporter substrate-binding protein [Chloroflexia bacterium]
GVPPATPAATAVPTVAAAAPTLAATTAPSATSSTIKNPNTLIQVSAGASDLNTLDPAFAYDSGSSGMIYNMYETLIVQKRDAVGEYVGKLATKWDVSADGKTYTFSIRKGVRFHQGQVLTPEDVAYSFQRTMILDVAGGPAWLVLQPFFGLQVNNYKDDVVAAQFNNDWVAACQAVQKAVAFDNAAGTVTLTLHQPYGPFLEILQGSWVAVLNKPWATQLGAWNGQCATAQAAHDPKPEDDPLHDKVNGTGPYKLERWAKGEEIVRVRFDDYWLKEPLWAGGPSGPARIERVVDRDVPEWGTRFAMLRAGDVDAAGIPRAYYPQVDPLVKEDCDAKTGTCTPTGNPNGFLRRYKGLPPQSNASGAIFLFQQVNTTGGNAHLGSGRLDGNGIPPDFFADVHVRKAFNYCYDRDTYIKQALQGEGTQVLGPIPPGELGYDPQQARYTYNLEQCAAEFKASTHKAADGRTLWDTGFLLQYVYPPGDATGRTQAQILKDSVAKVNPKFKLELVEVKSSEQFKEGFQSRLPLVSFGWTENFHDPHNWAQPYLHSKGYFGRIQHFAPDLQAELDRLVTAGATTTDRAERQRIYAQLQNLAYEQALDVFTVQALARRYEVEWVHGWWLNPMAGAHPRAYDLSKGP